MWFLSSVDSILFILSLRPWGPRCAAWWYSPWWTRPTPLSWTTGRSWTGKYCCCLSIYLSIYLISVSIYPSFPSLNSIWILLFYKPYSHERQREAGQVKITDIFHSINLYHSIFSFIFVLYLVFNIPRIHGAWVLFLFSLTCLPLHSFLTLPFLHFYRSVV